MREHKKCLDSHLAAFLFISPLLLAEGAGIQIPNKRLSKSIPEPFFPSSNMFLLLYTVAVALGDRNPTELLHVFQYKAR